MLNAPLGQLAIVRSRDAALAGLAITDHPHRNPLGHHRLCCPHSWICFSLAGYTSSRGRSYLRNCPNPHRHGAQSWPLWPLGLGSGSRPNFLVAVHVRDFGTRRQKTTCCHSAMSMRWCTRTTFAFTNLRLNLRTQRQLDRSRFPDAPRRRPLGVAARAMRIGASARRTRPSSDRYCRRHHGAEDLVQKTVAADMRLRDAIETIPEAFVLWDAENRLVLCNSNFQELHGLPDEAITVGASFEVCRCRRQQARRTQ